MSFLALDAAPGYILDLSSRFPCPQKAVQKSARRSRQAKDKRCPAEAATVSARQRGGVKCGERRHRSFTREHMFARHRIPPPPPLLPFHGPPLSFLGSGSPRDATQSFGRRVFRMWLLVTRWYHPLFSRLPLSIMPWARGGSPAYPHLPILVSVSEARFFPRSTVLQLPGFATGAADCLQASPHVCRNNYVWFIH